MTLLVGCRTAASTDARLARRGLVTLCLLLAGLTAPVTGQRVFDIAPPPSWVKPLALEVPEHAGEPGLSYETLLVDRQEAVRPSGVERFYHIAYRVLDESAVRENSQLELVVDSSYQRLILHSVLVRRGDRSVNQLTPGRIRVAQRETQLEYQIFDGSLSLVLLLEDVRPGDVIEYSYTRRGENPVFGAHYMSRLGLQLTAPLHRVRFRLLWPRDRRLFVRRHDTALEPEVRDDGEYREYLWDQSGITPKVLEGNLPAWYDPLPYIQLSDFASWADVAVWGDSLFSYRGPVPRSLADAAARIRAGSPSTTQRTLAALRFVQDEVRYMGVEIGANSHRPYPPAMVMQRRYGDCKDKTLLLITLLRELGVTARPALVSTEYRGRIRDHHPTARSFDHAIVQVEIDGQTHWIDPSALYERGGLEDVAARYGGALVLGALGDPLVEIREPPGQRPLTSITASIELGGVGKPAAMEVRTEYRGSAANAIREQLRSTPASELQRRYAEFYARQYPSLQSNGVPEIEEDEPANVVRTLERYSIPDFWQLSGSGKDTSRFGEFEPLELSVALPSTTSADRTMPLAIEHPRHIRYTINARIKEGWSIEPEETRLEGPGARFHYRVGAKGEVLTLEYEYETLADHVAAGPPSAEHIDQMAQAHRVLTYSITPPGVPSAGPPWSDVNPAFVLLGVMILGTSAWAASRVHRMSAAGWTAGPAPSPDAPQGLGGWLTLVGLGVCLAPVVILVGFAGILPSFRTATWASLTSPGGGAYHAMWAPALLFEFAINLAMIVFACLLILLFFRRKRVFPAAFVVFLWAQVAMILLDGMLAAAIPGVADGGTYDGLPRQVGVAVIWGAYMFRSQRVRATFVN